MPPPCLADYPGPSPKEGKPRSDKNDKKLLANELQPRPTAVFIFAPAAGPGEASVLVCEVSNSILYE